MREPKKYHARADAAERAEEVLDHSAATALRDEHFGRVLDAPYVPSAALQRAAGRR